MTNEERTSLIPTNDWISAKWRPMMGWMYMIVCIFDFIIFPILWTAIQAYDHQGVVGTEWEPLTLKGGGLFHMAMGAILGVAAWSRGQEKMTAMNLGMNAPMQQETSYVGQTPMTQTVARFNSPKVPQTQQPPLA
jgi:hypothetical protein